MTETLFDHSPSSIRQGSSVGVLVLHGFTGSPHSMRPVADFLASQGLDVEMPLLPGHGTSWQELEQTGYRRWVDAADQAYWSLRQRCKKVFLLGLSMGGGLALLEAARRPCEGLVLINPFIANTTPALALARYLRYGVRVQKAIGSDIALPGVDEGAYDRVPLAAAAQLHLLGREIRRCLPSLSVPVLYFRSAQDHIVTDASHQYFLKKAQSPVEFIRLDRSYHVATLDYDAPLIFDETLAFIRSHSHSALEG